MRSAPTHTSYQWGSFSTMRVAKRPSTSDVCSLPISALRQRYGGRQLNPADVTDAFFTRISAHDAVLRTFCALFDRDARRQAKESARRFLVREPVGLLDGVPIALKDVFDVAGTPTTGNSFTFVNNTAKEDSAVVKRLRVSGAILLGKTTLFELGSGDPDDGPAPAARNPWDLTATTGGSSSGSAAAVAAGFCSAALGTDAGGSARIPAAHCGVVGFKPTAELISTRGALPLSWSLDHVGLLARTTADVSLVFHALVKPSKLVNSSLHPLSASDVARQSPRRVLGGLRFGAPLDFVRETPGIDPEVADAYQRALDVLRKHGAHITPIQLPHAAHINVVAEIIALSEALAFHESTLRSRQGRYGRGFLAYLAKGAAYSAADYVQAQRWRALISTAFSWLMHDIDIIVTPTVSSPAGSRDSREPDVSKTRFTRPFNVTGQPAISVVMGLSSKGRPMGLQMAGRRGDDISVLAAASAFERISPDTGVQLTLPTAER